MSMSLKNKKDLVNQGKSEVFNSWSKAAGVTKDKFMEALKWLEEDPMVEVNGSKRLSREVGCKRNGTLIYGKRFYFSNGGFNAIYPEDASLTRLDFPMVSINKEDRI